MCTMEIGDTAKNLDLAKEHLTTVICRKESGKTMNCIMEKLKKLIAMVCTKERKKVVRGMDKANIHGMTVLCTMDSGETAKSMESLSILLEKLYIIS